MTNIWIFVWSSVFSHMHPTLIKAIGCDFYQSVVKWVNVLRIIGASVQQSENQRNHRLRM